MEGVWRICLLITIPCILFSFVSVDAADKEYVLTLDHTNLSLTIAKHDFIVLEFYAPWCGHCKNLSPEYEKAASMLSSHDPPITLAKIDASDEANKEVTNDYQIQGFPTIKILRNGGKDSQEYKGPREADGIVSYLKKQLGPASGEIKSFEIAGRFLNKKSLVIVGIFPKLFGKEFENFTILANKFRADYEFAHTLDNKLLPSGESSIIKPILRLFKPYDELVIDSQDFQIDAMQKFIEEESAPLLVIFDKDPKNHALVNKFFNSPESQVMLFVNFSSEQFDAFRSKYHAAAAQYKAKGLIALLGDVDAAGQAFEHYGFKEHQAPLIVIQANEEKYFKADVQPEDVTPWLNDYAAGKLEPFVKSEPIPEVNDDSVKVVVGKTLQDFVFNSGKNVFIEFYAAWCGHCQKLAPILDEVATLYAKEADDVLIGKLDVIANDFPKEPFNVKGVPTMYFNTASGKLIQYEGDRTKEAIIDFIDKNREGSSIKQDSLKDEL